MSVLSLCCRAFVVLMLRCYRVVFPAVLELLPHYCPNVVELLSLCYRFVVTLLLSFCGAVFTRLSRGCYTVVALLLRCFSLLLRRCRAVIVVLCAVFALLSHFGSFIFLFNSCSSFFFFILLFWDASIS